MWTDQCFAQQQLWSKHVEPEWNTTVVVGGTSHTVAQKCTHTMSGTATHVGNQTFPHMEILRCASSSFYRELFWHSASGSHKPTALQAEKNKPQTNLTPSERHPVTAVTAGLTWGSRQAPTASQPRTDAESCSPWLRSQAELFCAVNVRHTTEARLAHHYFWTSAQQVALHCRIPPSCHVFQRHGMLVTDLTWTPPTLTYLQKQTKVPQMGTKSPCSASGLYWGHLWHGMQTNYIATLILGKFRAGKMKHWDSESRLLSHCTALASSSTAAQHAVL